MARSAAEAPSTGFPSLQMGRVRDVCQRAAARVEHWLDGERDQIVLWIPVVLGAGVLAWFVLPDSARWCGFLAAMAALALAAALLPRGGRLSRLVGVGALLAAAGCLLAWTRAEWVAAPVLARPAIVRFEARVERVESLVARDLVRLTLAPVGRGDLPPRVRVNVAAADMGAGIVAGSRIALRARLMPPPGPAVPGAMTLRARPGSTDWGRSGGRSIRRCSSSRPPRRGRGCAPRSPRTFSTGCPAAPGGSPRRWRPAMKGRSPPKMPRRCAVRGSRICFR